MINKISYGGTLLNSLSMCFLTYGTNCLSVFHISNDPLFEIILIGKCLSGFIKLFCIVVKIKHLDSEKRDEKRKRKSNKYLYIN